MKSQQALQDAQKRGSYFFGLFLAGFVAQCLLVVQAYFGRTNELLLARNIAKKLCELDGGVSTPEKVACVLWQVLYRRALSTKGMYLVLQVDPCCFCLQEEYHLAKLISTGKMLTLAGSKSDSLRGLGSDERHAEERASWLSRLLFTWLTPLVITGFKRPLQPDDVWPLPKPYATTVSSARFETEWHRESTGAKPSLLRALHRTFGRYFYLAALPLMVQNASQFVPPVLLRLLIQCA